MSRDERDTAAGRQACEDLLVPGVPDGEGLLERLAHCLSQDMRRHAVRRCGNPADAEDAVQEAMAVAMRYLAGFRGESSLRSWLLRLVSTACTRQRRGRRNDPSLHTYLDPTEGVGAVLADPGPPPEEALLVEEKLQHVSGLLMSLGEEDRDLLLRHEGDRVPLAELAEETGQSVAAVRSRLYRVRQRLRSGLEDRFGDSLG